MTIHYGWSVTGGGRQCLVFDESPATSGAEQCTQPAVAHLALRRLVAPGLHHTTMICADHAQRLIDSDEAIELHALTADCGMPGILWQLDLNRCGVTVRSQTPTA